MNDFIDGHIDVPAGTSPVILVFDDANAGNFRYLGKNGEHVIDPDCAVAIMEEFYAQHPDFGLAATFYVYGENPFRQYDLVQEKLQYLVEKGFEIGNHTYSHSNLRKASPEEARRELALNVKRIMEWLPGYRVRSLALPYGEPYGGVPPEMDYLIRGSYEGVEYYNEAVLLVGANPSPSPFHRDFNPAGVPRVRASEMNTAGVGMYDWLQVLRETPGRRYISDGNPATVVVPENLKDRVQEDALQGKKLVTYQADQAK